MRRFWKPVLDSEHSFGNVVLEMILTPAEGTGYNVTYMIVEACFHQHAFPIMSNSYKKKHTF